MKTFSSRCELRQYGCQKMEIYVMLHHGRCHGEKEPGNFACFLLSADFFWTSTFLVNSFMIP